MKLVAMRSKFDGFCPKQLWLVCFAVFVLLIFYKPLYAQTFVELPSRGPGIVNAEAVWIRSGGKLHPLVTGEVKTAGTAARTLLFRQTGRNTFNSVKTSLPDLVHGAIDVGDFNGNRLHDVVISGTGSNGQIISGIYLQNTDGTFRKAPPQLPALADGSVQFADFDRDGDLDVLISGRDASGKLHTRILRNDNGQLTDININLPGIRFGKAKWVDLNRNGFPDVFITGQTTSGLISRIYINNNGKFTESGQHFTGLKHSDVAFADFNRDGLTDFVLAGETRQGTPYTRVFLNQGNMRFTEANNQGIRQLMHVSLDTGDMDNDGFPDFVIAGESLERPYTLVYQNQKGRGFKDYLAGLPGVSNGVVRFGDYDNDGDLDLFVAGIDVCFNLIASVFRNTLDPRPPVEEERFETIPLELAAGPKYYFVFSSCYCDPEHTGKKSYHGFVSNIHQEKRDFDLTYQFNHLLITRFPGWNWADRGHRTSNAFVSVQDAEEGRRTVIGSYVADNYKVHYLNW